MHDKSLSRRLLLASIPAAAMTGGAAATALGTTSETSTADPAFAAIDVHKGPCRHGTPQREKLHATSMGLS